jgi:hypothetical protein
MTKTSLAVDCHLKYNRVEGNTPNTNKEPQSDANDGEDGPDSHW